MFLISWQVICSGFLGHFFFWLSFLIHILEKILECKLFGMCWNSATVYIDFGAVAGMDISDSVKFSEMIVCGEIKNYNSDPMQLQLQCQL